MNEIVREDAEFDRDEALTTVLKLAQAAFEAGDTRFALMLEYTGRGLISALAGNKTTHSRFI